MPQRYCYQVSGGVFAYEAGESVRFRGGGFAGLYPARWSLAVIAAIIIVFQSFGTVFAEQPTEPAGRVIVVGGDYDYPPYEFLDDDGKPAGYNVELTRAIAEVMGMDVDIRLGPWGKVRADLQTGSVDILQGIYYSQDRDKVFEFSPPHTIVNQAIFVRRDSSEIKSVEDLRDKEIIVVDGDIMQDYALSNNLTKHLVVVESQTNALRLLASGKHHCALMAKLPGLYCIKKLKLNNITAAGKPIQEDRYCYAVRHGNEELPANFNQGLAIIKLTGREQQIYDKWLGVLEPREIHQRKIFIYAAAVLIPLLCLLVLSALWSMMLRRQVAVRTATLQMEVTEHKHTEDALCRANRALRVLSECNQALIRPADESDLLNGVCRIIVEVGKYRLAWVGFAVQDEKKTVQPVAQAGYEDGYLSSVNITWDDAERGRGPTGTAIRTGKPSINKDILTNPDYAPWRAEAAKRGYASSIALPLSTEEQAFGALNIYAAEPNAFDSDEVKLLMELANDLAFSIRALRTRAAHKQSELALRLSEQCFRAIADYTYWWEIWISPEGNLLWTNPAAQRVTGYSIEECRAMPVFPVPVVYEQDCERIARAFKSALKGSSGKEVEFRIRRKDGTVIWADISWQPIYDEKGVSQGYRASIRDITDRKQAEETLRESEERYRLFVHNFQGIAFRGKMDWTPIFFHGAVEAITGYTEEEFTAGKPRWDQIIHPDDLKKIYEGGEKMRSVPNYSTSREYRIIRKDEQIRWVQEFIQNVCDDSGEPILVQGAIYDITERKQAEEALRSARDDWKNIFESISDMVLVLDRDHRILDANRAAAATLKRPKEEIIGRYCYELFHCTDHPPEGCPHEKLLSSGHSETAEMEVEILNGIYLVTVAPVLDRQGKIVKTLHIARDITQRKHAEEQREQLVRMLALKNKELESILYVASHDLRSPLVNIQGFSHELSRSCDLVRSALKKKGIAVDMDEQLRAVFDKDVPEALGFILTSASKMDSLLSGLLRLSRLGSAAVNIEPLDMNSIMANVVDSMEYQTKEAGATVKIDPLPACLGDASQINQVFSNLLDNALKYLDDSRPGMIHIYGGIEDGQSIYCVEDNGVGIAPSHQNKIFEIFHRLEPQRKSGEGLGLAIVRRILDGHNGRIWVESELGKGSKFFVSLPSV